MISGDELVDIKACHTGTLKKPAMIRSLLEDWLDAWQTLYLRRV